MKIKIFILSLIFLLFLAGCIKMKHDMTIQPIHVTVEIKVKIDKELENFFSDIDDAGDQKKAQQETGNKEGKK